MDLSDIFRSDKIHAAFSLKTLFNSGNERKLLSSLINLDPKKIVTPEQIHSSEVKIVDTPGKISSTDAIISSSKSLVLSIQVADCIPLYLADPYNNVIGLVHAGWRGIEKGIVENSINKMIKTLFLCHGNLECGLKSRNFVSKKSADRNFSKMRPL